MPTPTKTRSPRQKRSRERVSLILKTAREALQEHGLEKLSTNSIAAQAEIPVGSIYQYFPDKVSILEALYREYLENIRLAFEELDSIDIDSMNWEVYLKHQMSALFSAEQRDSIALEFEKALVLFPTLVEIDREHEDIIVDQMMKHFVQLGAHWAKPKLKRLLHFLYAINGASWTYQATFTPSVKELQEWNFTTAHALVRNCMEK